MASGYVHCVCGSLVYCVCWRENHDYFSLDPPSPLLHHWLVLIPQTSPVSDAELTPPSFLRTGGTWEEVWAHLEVVAGCSNYELPKEVRPASRCSPSGPQKKVADPCSLPVPPIWMRDESQFMAGGLAESWPFWRDVLLPLSGLPVKAPGRLSRAVGGPVLDGTTIASWIQEGVRLDHFLRPFGGTYKGVAVASEVPVSRSFENPPLPFPKSKYESFVDTEVAKSVLCGAVEEVTTPPFLILPLIVEPRKPRLCFDARWANLWFPSPKFRFDTLRDFQRGVRRNDWMFSIDHKSGYQHVRMHPSAHPYLGFSWRGRWYRYRVLPFGVAPACYIYQSLSLVVSAALRRLLRLNVIAYIDDFGFSLGGDVPLELRQRVRWIVLAVMYLAGFFVSEKKSQLLFTRELRLLGLIVDSSLERFRIPLDKLDKFQLLRREVLECTRGDKCVRPVDIRLLQQLTGKAESMSLAVPPVSIFLRHIWDCLASALAAERSSVWLSSAAVLDLVELGQISMWEPLSRWLPERHMSLTLRLETDASLGGYGGVWFTGSGSPTQIAGLFVGDEAPLDIAPKEALAVRRALELAPPSVQNCFVDLYVDNEVVEKTLLRGSSVIPEIRAVARDLLKFELARSVVLHIARVSTVDNVTSDRLSRGVVERPWQIVDKNDFALDFPYFDKLRKLLPFGAEFTLDVCASPRNTRVSRFISRVTFPASEIPSGLQCVAVNVFTYEFLPRLGPGREWVYCYPPVALVSPLWRHLRLCGARGVIVFPEMPEQIWFASILREACRLVRLAERGCTNCLLAPLSGYSEFTGPLPRPLMAALFDFEELC